MDQAITQLPDYNKLGHLTKLRLNPENIPDLDWQLASELNTTSTLYRTAKINDQTVSTGQAMPIVMAEITTKPIKLNQD